jgi:NADPH:quinone reductase-like Zn-dependent oxidoreductase
MSTTTSTTATMRAVVRRTYGEADVLDVDRVPVPEPGRNEVLLRVRAAGLDRGTWHVMTGRPYAARLAFGLRRPKRPGLGIDVAGTVVAVGPGVTRFAPGDEVFGFGAGTFAEYALARQDQLAPRPADLPAQLAAVAPVSGGTALQACDAARIQRGQRVLVVGASGGVGSYAVQIATALGAEVTAVASTAKQDFVRSLGAVRAIDYTREDFADGSVRYDAILDVGGNTPLPRLRRALTPTGTLVIVGGEGAGNVTGMGRQMAAVLLSPFVRQRLTMLVAAQRGVDLDRLAELIAGGLVKPRLDEVYPLERAADAMARLVAGTVRGKLAISI